MLSSLLKAKLQKVFLLHCCLHFLTSHSVFPSSWPLLPPILLQPLWLRTSVTCGFHIAKTLGQYKCSFDISSQQRMVMSSFKSCPSHFLGVSNLLIFCSSTSQFHLLSCSLFHDPNFGFSKLLLSLNSLCNYCHVHPSF